MLNQLKVMGDIIVRIYEFNYRGRSYRVMERELEYGVLSAKKNKRGYTAIIVNSSLSDREKSKELHRLINSRGLIKL